MAATDIGFLIAARFLQALGACAGVVLARAVVRDVYGRERAAKALSYMSMAMALAPALGPILGGYLQVWFGWRANFLVLAGFGAGCLLAVFLLLPETNASRDAAATRGTQVLRNYLTLARDPAYLGYVPIGAFAYGGIFAFISGSSFVLIDVLGLSPDRYGLCFGAVVVGYMIGTFASGRLSLAVGLDRLILTGTLVALGLALSGVLGVAAVVAPTFLYLIGAGLMLPNAIAGAIGPYPTMAGTASAFLGVVQMGLAASVGIAVGHLHDGTARGMFGATAAVAAGALASYLLLVRRDGRAARRLGSSDRRPGCACPRAGFLASPCRRPGDAGCGRLSRLRSRRPPRRRPAAGWPARPPGLGP